MIRQVVFWFGFCLALVAQEIPEFKEATTQTLLDNGDAIISFQMVDMNSDGKRDLVTLHRSGALKITLNGGAQSAYPISCQAIKQMDSSAEDGVYWVDVDGDGDFVPFEVYCDMTTDGGGWTVIQRRVDGTVDFLRDWMRYKQGFGILTGEFWLGNDKIHRLTNVKNTELRIELEDRMGKQRFAKYHHFKVANEYDYYRLSVNGFVGNAGDSLSAQNGYAFSTYDFDNDGWSENCAETYLGAWWYKDCHQSNLNGFYYNGRHSSYGDGIEWETWTGQNYSLSKVEIKIR